MYHGQVIGYVFSDCAIYITKKFKVKILQVSTRKPQSDIPGLLHVETIRHKGKRNKGTFSETNLHIQLKGDKIYYYTWRVEVVRYCVRSCK